jgi:hypothetical protein
MATFNETIMLENSADASFASRGLMKAEDVRKMQCSAVVDSGAWTLVISPEVQQKLGLRKIADSSSEVAGGIEMKGWETEPVTIYWKDRSTAVRAFVLPGQEDVLFGALPMEAMDLKIDMKAERIVGKHGAKPLYRV